MIIGRIVPGQEGYAWQEQLPEKGIARRWVFHGLPRSIEWRGGGIVKSIDGFSEHRDDPQDMLDLLAEAYPRGVERPSSYGDLFHQENYQPATRAAHRKLFPPGCIPGGWNATPLEKRVRDHLYKYDIRSAYLAALMEGLPHPETFRVVKRVDGPGLYWVPSPCHPFLPHPWNKTGWHPATEEELLALPLDVKAVTYGIRYEPGTIDTERWVKNIQAWSCWKAVGRSYWGRWIASGAPLAQTFDPAGDLRSERELPDNRRNPVWAAIITSRLRLRLWKLWDAGDRRIYRLVTDSVVTDTPLETGEGVGEWKLEEEYPHGAILTVQQITPLPRAA